MLWRKKYTEEWRKYIVSMEDYEQAKVRVQHDLLCGFIVWVQEKVLIKVPLFGQNFQDDTKTIHW